MTWKLCSGSAYDLFGDMLSYCMRMFGLKTNQKASPLLITSAPDPMQIKSTSFTVQLSVRAHLKNTTETFPNLAAQVLHVLWYSFTRTQQNCAKLIKVSEWGDLIIPHKNFNSNSHVWRVPAMFSPDSVYLGIPYK